MASAVEGKRSYAAVIAAGAAVQSVEALFPSPLPGIKPGFANGLTLAAFQVWGAGAALQITCGRILTGALALGTLLTPSFLMSVSGALCSFPVMTGLFRWARRAKGVCRPGLAGISLAGALAHNAGQMAAAGLFVVRGPEIIGLTPFYLISSLMGGWLTAWFGHAVCGRIGTTDGVRFSARKKNRIKPLMPPRPVVWLFLAGLICSLLFLSLTRRPVLSLSVAGVSGLLLLVLSRRTFIKTLAGILPLGLALFILPVFFQRGGEVLFGFGSFFVTLQALERGLLLSSRVIGLSFAGRIFFCLVPVESLLSLVRERMRSAAGFITDVFEAFDRLPDFAAFFGEHRELWRRKGPAALADFFAGFFREEDPR